MQMKVLLPQYTQNMTRKSLFWRRSYQVLQWGHATYHDHPHFAGERAAAALREVDGGVVPWFREAARDLLAEYTDPEEALARALAKVTGHTALQVCSSGLL